MKENQCESDSIPKRESVPLFRNHPNIIKCDSPLKSQRSSLNMYQMIMEEKAQTFFNERHKNTAELLLEEISKPKNVKEFGFRKKLQFHPKVVKKDVDKIAELLKTLPGFRQFMKFNNVDDDSIRIAANCLTLKFVNKNEYLFKQGDESKHFFGIISGKISIRRLVVKVEEQLDKLPRRGKMIFKNYSRLFPILKKMAIKGVNDTPKTGPEEELLCKSDGYCFGEWGLIDKKVRSSSAFALEDTCLFVLDEESFNLSFSKCLNKAEQEKRNFVRTNIFPFLETNQDKFDQLYKSVIPIVLWKNEFVCLENWISNKFFMVYMGDCKLEKKIAQANGIRDASKMKFQTLMKIQKGGLVGLECLYGVNRYKYTVRADSGSDYTIVLALRVDKIMPDILSKLQDNFRLIYENLDKAVEALKEKKNLYGKQTKIYFKKHFGIFRNKENLKEEEEQLEKIVAETVEDMKETALKGEIMSKANLKHFKKRKANLSKIPRKKIEQKTQTTKKITIPSMKMTAINNLFERTSVAFPIRSRNPPYLYSQRDAAQLTTRESSSSDYHNVKNKILYSRLGDGKQTLIMSANKANQNKNRTIESASTMKSEHLYFNQSGENSCNVKRSRNNNSQNTIVCCEIQSCPVTSVDVDGIKHVSPYVIVADCQKRKDSKSVICDGSEIILDSSLRDNLRNYIATVCEKKTYDSGCYDVPLLATIGYCSH